MIQNIFRTLQYILSIVALLRDAVAIYIYHIYLVRRGTHTVIRPAHTVHALSK